MEVFKEKARNKQLTREDMLTYCLIKAIKAKNENKAELAKIFIVKTFTPRKTGEAYEAVRLSHYWVNYRFQYYGTIFGKKATEILSGPEIDLFVQLLDNIRNFPR